SVVTLTASSTATAARGPSPGRDRRLVYALIREVGADMTLSSAYEGYSGCLPSSPQPNVTAARALVWALVPAWEVIVGGNRWLTASGWGAGGRGRPWGGLPGAAASPAAARCAGPGGGAATQARARWPHQRARLLLHATCCHYPAASISNTVCAL